MGLQRSEIESRLRQMIKSNPELADIAKEEAPFLIDNVEQESITPTTLKRSDIESRLRSLIEKNPELEKIAEEEAPFLVKNTNRLGQTARGFLSGIGAGADISQPGNPLMNDRPDLYEDLEKYKDLGENPTREQLLNIAINPKVRMSEELPKAFGYGEEYVPSEKDTLGKVVNFAGELAAPSPALPMAGYSGIAKAAGKGAGALTKALGKEAALSGATAGAIKATPRLTEEGTDTGMLEDFAKGMFGARAAEKVVNVNIIKALKRVPRSMANKALGASTFMANPNERTFELAEKHGVKLPFNVGMRSKPMNWAANNYLKSIFTSGVYEDAIKEANESMVNAVKRNIDELGTSTLKPSEASGEFRRFIQSEEKIAEEQAKVLYDDASKFLSKKDVVKPKNTASFISNLDEMLSRDIQSPATKKVANIVGSLAESWGLAPPGKTLKQLENNPKLIQAYLDQFRKNIPNVPVEKLIGIRKELGTITNFDPTIKGSESYLNGLRSVIDKDIETMNNKEFLSKWREANSSFKTSVADRFRGDVARSLLANEMPTEAFSLLNSPENIKEISKIAGKSPKSEEIFNALKKAKVREIFSSALQDESLRTTPFINIFNKKEKNAELLESLVGKQNFNKLSEISEIAEEFKHANQELLNTSRTALTSSEIAKAEKLTKGVLSTIFNGAVGSGVGAMAGIGSAGGAAIGIAMPNLISRLVANPRFVNEARAYAIARKNNNKIYSDTLLKRIVKLTDTEKRLMDTELRSMNEEGE
jgi:hypothetical protein